MCYETCCYELFLQILLASRSVLKSVQIADFIKKYVYKVKN